MRQHLHSTVFYKYTLFILLITKSFFVFSQEKIDVKQSNISSSSSEYAPTYYKNGLVFSNVSSNDDPNKSMTGLYFAPFKKNKFGNKSVFSSALKSGLHEGAITFSTDGITAYFTRSQKEFNDVGDSLSTQENKLGVYKTTYDGNEWGNITPCNFIQPEFSFGHPSLSLDGKRLYIASDVDGGFGGKDIYYTEITNGVCGPLINLGPGVNSSANEFFPSIDPNGNLYFSSDKEGGIGGLDLYLTQLIKNKWSTPKLLDAPINSEFDDFSIVWNKNGIEGYFASNRKGTDDIFKITITTPKPGFNECVPMEREYLCYEFYEEATVYVDSVEMIYEWDFGDGIKSNLLSVNHCYSKIGTYQVKLNILDKIIGKEYMEKAAFELIIKEVLQPKIILPETFVLGDEFSITVEQGKWKPYQIDNYYIDYGDLEITKNSALPHQYTTPGEKEIKVLVSGIDAETKKVKTNCFSKTIMVKTK
ncbi:MAG: PKD domain-containing protein [Vicingaceae bacterium]|nr:PKD domain-containing protein [Vicingaceae bacterium]